MKAETIHRSAKQPQPSARDHTRIVRYQRAVQNIEVGLELGNVRVSGGLADWHATGLYLQPRSGRGKPRIDTGHGESIRFAASMRRCIGRALRERAQLLRDIGQVGRARQYGAEHLQYFEIMAHNAAGLHLKRATHHFRGDERIPIAIAADPASHLQ